MSAIQRLAVSVLVGASIGAILWFGWAISPTMTVWTGTAITYVGWTWATLGPMDAAQTARFARREDPTHAGTAILVVTAALGSLASIILVLIHHDDTARLVGTLIGIVASWATIHTLFATHYARLYFTDPVGGVDFHQSDPPLYTDFAYVAFTVGMSFAISDTDLFGSRMRRPALLHALLSYLFGTVIVALLINLLAGVAG